MLFFYLLMYVLSQSNGAIVGPYKCNIVRVTDCDKPSLPYIKDPTLRFIPQVHNVSDTLTLSGNVTVTQDTKNVKHRIKGFIWQDGAWKVNILLNDHLNCHGVVMHMLSVAANMKYDRKKCMFLKGSYYFGNLDVNAVMHLWTSSMEYGKIMWRNEAYNLKLGSFYCYNFEMVTEPLK